MQKQLISKNTWNNNVDAYLNASIKNITLLGVSKNEKNIGCGDADIAKILYVLNKGFNIVHF